MSASRDGPLVFQGPTPTIQTQATLRIDGDLSLEAFPRVPNPFRFARGTVQLAVTIAGVTSNLTATAGDDSDFYGVMLDISDYTGVTAVVGGSSVSMFGNRAKTLPFTVPTGVEVPAQFLMRLNFNHLSNGFPGSSSFNGNFANSMSWTRSGPVFDLPPGYTVNGMGIVDNQYVIPEPASASLAIFLAALFGASNRRTL
jgi:hypothetical protein